ncbi:CtsR family transcriptional regulator [Aerococcus kribbianus]|uniref:Transcriptional regulator CtsR n=1 Tax=Aerococcus kribbianus TaxID=2999064 RepID=A0A9X3JDW6_9LACT|nr:MULTISPECIES: CtsR family transcriptional regulator [unclassified Aerococcus]MCZ0717936.1 CtsR family transcriptional regulator [Aerococcus sp. YH-aer221]MCZ0726223.1 CtsR family transcriptional regulator [Aerococcus sp. YH-aer222]
MQNESMSDIIATYINKILQEQERIEIQRKQMADRFQCVPSQINYVIKTRFTPENGYVVESKRGGGGYIRIMKLDIADESDFIDAMLAMVDEQTSDRDAAAIITNLYNNEIISKREAQLMYAALDKDALSLVDHPNRLRSEILRNLLVKLKYQ